VSVFVLFGHLAFIINIKRMKKTKMFYLSIGLVVGIIAILTSNNVIAFYKTPLETVWGERADLQKVFPGDPKNNPRLTEWAEKYGYKENDLLLDYYKDKGVIDKIVEKKYEERIKSLENKIVELTTKINQISTGSTGTVPAQPITYNQTVEGTWRSCSVSRRGDEYFGPIGNCELFEDDKLYPDRDNIYEIKFLTK
jgi:hypothetical protein